MKASSSAKVANKSQLASTITAIQTVKTVVVQVTTAIEMEQNAQMIMSHQECNSKKFTSGYTSGINH